MTSPLQSARHPIFSGTGRGALLSLLMERAAYAGRSSREMGRHGGSASAVARRREHSRRHQELGPCERLVGPLGVIFGGAALRALQLRQSESQGAQKPEARRLLVRKTVEIIEHFHAANPACSSLWRTRHQHALEALGLAQALGARDDTQSSLPAILFAQSLSLGQISRGVQRSSVSSSRHKTPLTVCVENTKAPNLVLECILLCTGAGKSRTSLACTHIKPDPLFLTVTGTPIARPVSEPRSPPALDPGPVPLRPPGPGEAKRGGADRASGDPAKRSRRRRVRGDGVGG
ncbi:hypothetical protein Q5P01_000683 [Channa striata]|uniref:Uncharacterized protein n=1 Tax=Channa striata TaxID=64152 RepID=A0AA88IJU9_CHASR|nr:hypothetical protein Q5P01_000683 [Channa striata]